MNKLTFAFDVQLDEQENYIASCTQVEISNNPFHLNRYTDSTPVIINKAYNHKGNQIKINPTIEWFLNSSFVELR